MELNIFKNGTQNHTDSNDKKLKSMTLKGVESPTTIATDISSVVVENSQNKLLINGAFQHDTNSKDKYRDDIGNIKKTGKKSVPPIEVSHLKFHYPNGVNALKDISFNVKEGDLVAIIGPNGSGKSTLLKLLDGILTPDSGSIKLLGLDIKKYLRRDIAKIISFVPQNESPRFFISVFETILIGRTPYIAWNHPSKEDIRITSKIIGMLNLEDLALRKVNELSGGQLQKVNIGRALAQETKIILLDEPTANLDLKHQIEVMKILKNITLQGKSVIIAIHDINLAAKYCNKFILLNDGKIIASGESKILTEQNLEKIYEIPIKIIKENGGMMIVPIV